MTTETYVINMATGGISTYSGDLWNAALGIATLNNKLYVAGPLGLFEATGTTDDGTDIDCYIKTGKLMAGDRQAEKQVHHFWVTLAGTDDCEATLYPSFWDGENTIGPYDLTALSTAQPHNRVLRGLLGEAGQWWSVKIANKNGGAFDLRSAVLILDQTKILM